MKIRRIFTVAAVLSGLLLAPRSAPAQQGRAPAAAHFLAPDAFQLEKILPPPPAPGSLAARADLETVLQAQAWRTPEQVAWALRVEPDNLGDFADVLGPLYGKAHLPLTVALVNAVNRDMVPLMLAAKKSFARPRPFVADPRVQPCVRRREEYSYPSGHATSFHLAAGVLSEIFPGKRAELFQFARRLSWGRVIGGVHYPTDLEAGRLSAERILAALDANPAFRQAVEDCRREVAALPDGKPEPSR